jgi:hypothetical protein
MIAQTKKTGERRSPVLKLDLALSLILERVFP